MKQQKRTIDKNELNEFITRYYTTPNSGVTLAYPNYYPELFRAYNIYERNPRANVLLGGIMTKPSRDRYVFGCSYYDLTEDKPNEDLYEIDPINSTVTPYYKGLLNKNDPLYKNTHKASKDFLLKPSKMVEIFLKRKKFQLEKLLNIR